VGVGALFGSRLGLNAAVAAVGPNATTAAVVWGLVEVIHDDVVHFAFPDAPTLLYLYNPFGPETLAAVLRNLEESLRQHPTTWS
jgi:hypothetical protein